MKAEYKRDLQNNYLILEAAQDEKENGYDLKMAEQNRIQGLLPMHITGKDGKRYFYYEITSRQPIQSLYEKKKMKSKDILFLFTSLNKILGEMHRYLLSPRQLVFDPEMIYMEPDRRGIQFCYFPGGDYPVILLAEFLLKKLDHEDAQAVTLGYQFYQRAGGDNFSLTDTLQEILAEAQEERCRERDAYAEAGSAGQEGYVSEEEPEEPEIWRRRGFPDMGAAKKAKRAKKDAGRRAEPASSEKKHAEDREKGLYETKITGQGLQVNRKKRAEAPSEKESYHAGSHEQNERSPENAAPGRHRGRSPENAAPGRRRERSPENAAPGRHRGRSADSIASAGKRKSFPERLFSVIHPAVLLSVLALTVVLELLYALSVIGITEAGGCFFLLLSCGVFVNRFLKTREKKKNTWQDEEENTEEEYEELLKNMYAFPKEKEREPAGVTRCLRLQPEDGGLRLVYQRGNESGENPQMIEIGRKPSYIGKIRGESDVVLDCDTVSRTHAKLEQKGDNCIVQDLNSRNGTFLNGKRLMPQEECVLRAGDFLVFAEVEYRVIRKGVLRNDPESAPA